MRKKLSLRVLGLVLATSLLFSACGNNAEVSKESTVAPTEKESVVSESSETAASEQEEKKELVTLNWYLTVNGTNWGTEQVLKSVNEYVLEKLNVDLQIHVLSKAEYREKVGTMLTAGDNVDICFTAPKYADFASYAQMGAFYPLNEFMDDELAGTVARLPEGVWSSVSFDDNVYAIPTMKDLVSRYALRANQTMLDDLGVTMPSKLETAADLIPMLREAKAAQVAKYPDKANTPLMDDGMRNLEMWYFFDALQGTMVIANMPGLKGFAGYGEGETAFCTYYTQEFRDTMKLIQNMVDEKIFAYDHEEFDADKVLSSEGGLIGQYANGNVYCATKHAVDALTKGMRIDLLPYNIRVSQICPGAVETEFSVVRFKGDQERADNVYKGFAPLTAMDVADAIMYMIKCPAHVNINDMVIMPTAQANSYTFYKEL